MKTSTPIRRALRNGETKQFALYVAARDIQLGQKGDATNCPIAISMRNFLQARRVAVMSPYNASFPVTLVVYDNAGVRWEGEIYTASARGFCHSFDSGVGVLAQYFQVGLWRV